MNTSAQNVLYDDEFLSNDDPFVFDDDETQIFDEINNTTTKQENEQQQTKNSSDDLVILLKQAKGRDDQYEDHFPPSLLCHPYKYDLKIVGKIENHNQHKLSLKLVDSETLIVPNVALPNKKIDEAVVVEQIEEMNANERLIRFTFNLCSFHAKRRPFRLELTQSIDGTTKRLFLSTPFHTFARRREHHQSFGSSKLSDKHSHHSTPLTPDSNNSNSSSGSILSSPKSDGKHGVKRSISNVNTAYYPDTKSRNLEQATSPTILNPSAVPHYATGPFTPYMFPPNYAAVAAAYHQEMAQQFASMPMTYGTTKMPIYYPQWPTYNPIVFGSPQTSPVSPPSNVIVEKTDVLGALTECDKKKKDQKIIHHTPLNFVQQQAPAVDTSSERASLAIQLFKTLTPTERQAVSMFINSSTSNV